MQDFFDTASIQNEYDLVIIGGGPAGCTAALYAARDEISVLVLEKKFPGGQIAITAHIDNYPGCYETISGYDLSVRFRKHAEKFGAVFRYGFCTDMQMDGLLKKIYIDGRENPIIAKSVVIATGCTPKTLGVQGESKFFGRGVSACATCDGGFYEGKVVAAVGGGDTALEETAYLTRFVQKVYLIHRRDEFRASKTAQRMVKENCKIEIVYDSVVTSVNGDTALSSVDIQNVKSGETRRINTDGLFVFIGHHAQAAPFDKILPVDGQGFLRTNENTSTELPGVYVAGDVRSKELRQIATAVGDGATASKMVSRFLQDLAIGSVDPVVYERK